MQCKWFLGYKAFRICPALPQDLYWSSELKWSLLEILRRSQNIDLIGEIISSRLYENEDAVFTAFENRHLYNLYSIINNLCEGYHFQEVVRWPRGKIIEEILDLVAPGDMVDEEWTWDPSRAESRENIEAIATEINTESYRLFRKVTFEGWTRFALGYEEEAVFQLSQKHLTFVNALSQYLSHHRDESKKYNKVMRKLHNGCPLARQGLKYCLDRTPQRHFSFDFIVGPLQSWLWGRTHTEVLERLPVLRACFLRQYVATALDGIRWGKDLSPWLVPFIFRHKLRASRKGRGAREEEGFLVGLS